MAKRSAGRKARHDEAPFRWGIIGTGAIAEQFVDDLTAASGALVAAVTSRTKRSAEKFARAHGVEAVLTLNEMLKAPGIDAIYIASPNSTHADIACRALDAGKPVLVEKPLATSVADAARIMAAAKKSELLAMEGLWTRFLPAIAEVRRLLGAKSIGEIVAIEAELCYRHEGTDDRFFDPKLGGGAALDLGVYPLSLALDFFGEPTRVDGRWWRAETDVDYRTEFLLRFGKAQARLVCSFDREGTNSFVILGTKGAIVIQAPFLKARRIRLYGPRLRHVPFIGARSAGLLSRLADRLPLPGRKVRAFSFPKGGLQFELRAFMDAVRAGKSQVAQMPLSQSMKALEIIEAVLSQPAEK